MLMVAIVASQEPQVTVLVTSWMSVRECASRRKLLCLTEWFYGMAGVTAMGNEYSGRYRQHRQVCDGAGRSADCG